MINLDKSKFCSDSLKYLGYVIDPECIKTDPEKIEAMVSYATPKNFTEVKRLISLCSWYQRFVKEFSTVIAPITVLTKRAATKKRFE